MTAQILWIAGLILLSAFFSGSEIAYSSANRLRLRTRAEEGGTAAERLTYALCESYESVLITHLLGNNLVNIAASSVATVIAIGLLGAGGADRKSVV